MLDEVSQGSLHEWSHQFRAEPDTMIWLYFQNIRGLNMTNEDGPVKLHILHQFILSIILMYSHLPYTTLAGMLSNQSFIYPSSPKGGGKMLSGNLAITATSCNLQDTNLEALGFSWSMLSHTGHWGLETTLFIWVGGAGHSFAGGNISGW